MKYIIGIIFIGIINLCLGQENHSMEIYFENNSFQISQEYKNELITYFHSKKEMCLDSIIIEGYCSNSGSNGLNDKLSSNRCNQVKQLLSKEIKTKYTIKSYGKRFQKYTDNEDKNRRVFIEIFYHKEEPKIVEKEIKKGDVISFPGIQFKGGTPIPLPTAYAYMDELFQILESNPEMEIEIRGHICCAITDDDDLSGRRAQTVYYFLIDRGIDSSRLSYKGFGRTQPLTDESTAEKQQMNRRVEIFIKK